MSYRVRTESFEGPFDLLLYLVSRQRVDIGAISVSEIVDQYLDEVARMQRLDLDVASDFLLVASTLLEIKAQALIPRESEEEDEDIAELSPSEARDLLVERLLVYKKYKNAAAAFERRDEEQARMHARECGPGPEFADLAPDFLHGVSLDSLAFLAASAFGRRESALLESEHIAAKPIPVEVHVALIRQRLESEKTLHFSDLVKRDTPKDVAVVTFLALLELYKRSIADLSQDLEFGDIRIDYIGQPGGGEGEPAQADEPGAAPALAEGE